MRKFCLLIIVVVLISLFPNFKTSYAHDEIIHGVGKCVLINTDESAASKSIAKDNALKDLKSKAFFYIEEYSHTNNFVLKEDQINVIAIEDIQIQKEEYSYEIDATGNQWIIAYISAVMDPNYYFEVIKKRNTELNRKYENSKDMLEGELAKKSAYEDTIKIYASYNNAVNLIQIGEYNNAIKCIEAIPDNSTISYAWAIKGDAYKNMHSYDTAIDCYTKAIKLDFRSLKAYLGRGEAYYEQGLYQKALVDFNVVVALNRTYPMGYKKRGMTYEKIGNNSKAISDYAKANELERG